MEYIWNNSWNIAKENLLGVDCLAAFRGIQEHGLSTSLVERDVSENTTYQPIFMIRNGDNGEPRSADLPGRDLTQDQISNLVTELRQLDRKNVASEDIKSISNRYWPAQDASILIDAERKNEHPSEGNNEL
jgi:hypothetical protein